MKPIIFIIIICVLSSISISASERIQLLPVDEGHKNQSFVEFRERLLKALKEKDRVFLEKCIAEDIVTQTDGIEGYQRYFYVTCDDEVKVEMRRGLSDAKKEIRGKGEFIRFWFELREPWRSDGVFEVMRGVLEYGGSFIDDKNTLFRAPYTWSEWPENTDYHYAVVSDSVVIRYGFELTDTLSYDLVYSCPEIDFNRPGSLTIRTHDGKEGRISRDKIKGPHNIGMEIEYVDGNWWITKFASFP